MLAKKDSATALSQHTPVLPTDRVTPRSVARVANWAEVYWAGSVGRRNTGLFEQG